jgi:hypothetical protein
MNLHFDSPATPSRRNPASRSNLVRLGTLALAVVFTATQLPAQVLPAETPQAATQQAADASAGSAQTPATNTTATAAVPSAPSDAVKSNSNALPEAPLASAANQETASATMPPSVRAMFTDAVQQSQSLQSTPKSTSKGIQRPGMLVMGIIGLPIAALGVWALSAGVSKDAAAKNIFGASLLGGGGLMAGFGFTYAFKPINR